MLSEFFSSVFNKNVGSRANTDLRNNAYFNDRLERIKIDEEEVIIVTDKNYIRIQREQGPGCRWYKFELYALKIKHIVAYPLKLLFEKSLQIQKVPDAWKKANVIPLFKKGDKSLVNNYRPVSLTVIFGKVLEKIIKKNMERFLSEVGWNISNQHGFVKGRSCLSNLLIWHKSVMDHGNIR